MRTVCNLFLFLFSQKVMARVSGRIKTERKQFKWMKISQRILMKNNLFVSMENCVENENSVSFWEIKPFSWLNYPPFFASLNFFSARVVPRTKRKWGAFVDGFVSGWEVSCERRRKNKVFFIHKQEKMSKRSSKKNLIKKKILFTLILN